MRDLLNRIKAFFRSLFGIAEDVQATPPAAASQEDDGALGSKSFIEESI